MAASELGRVLANLLLNAIRHTPSDGAVRVDGGSATGGWVTVTDGNFGGIPESDLPRVFDVAFRGAAARSPDPDPAPRGGGGLGLAIVRGLVDLHGGDVWLRTPPPAAASRSACPPASPPLNDHVHHRCPYITRPTGLVMYEVA